VATSPSKSRDRAANRALARSRLTDKPQRLAGGEVEAMPSQIVEQGAAAEVLRRPLHPYTKGLIASFRRTPR
jgi:ABC-type dipeptide/oligopeptide/nickel transport system ATPase component